MSQAVWDRGGEKEGAMSDTGDIEQGRSTAAVHVFLENTFGVLHRHVPSSKRHHLGSKVVV